jgi:GTPase
MSKFTDTVTINIKAGHGGPGCISFHRAKYLPKGGPDGGDGGRGGDLYFVADTGYTNLSYLLPDKIYAAKAGRSGEGNNKHGADGKDLVIKLPVGTEITNAETGEVLADLIEPEKAVLLATGGIGGKGNAFFKTSTHQTPRIAQPGLPGEELTLTLNLKLIADVGLVGLPNAGKSTLLSKLTNAKPKIADYPFTTLIPNLGIVQNAKKQNEFSIADIPGIIEGAHKGHGLGLSFLQHIERVKIIVYLIDIQTDDPPYALKLLQEELKSYNKNLAKKPSLIVLNKIDIVNDPAFIKDVKKQFKKAGILDISADKGVNLDKLIDKIETMLEK